MRKIIGSTLFLFLITVAPIFASDEVPWADGRSAAENIEIILLSFGPGDSVTDWWGHITLAISDTSLKVSRVYNFGFYSFDEGFISRFAFGRLIFWKGAVSWGGTLNRYVNANRTILLQKLNIPVEARLKIAIHLADEVKPENAKYLYHHYTDNCATRLRDLIDDGIGGQFADSTAKPARLTYRQHTLRYTAHNKLMQWLLMFLMNDSIDKEIHQWDEMFLPDELAKYARSQMYTDSNNQIVPLVSQEEVYYKSDHPPVPFDANNAPAWTWISGLLIALTIFFSAQGAAKLSKTSIVIYTSLNLFITLVLGILGSLLFFMALFTDHLVTHWNENLFLVNPLFLLLFILQLIGLFKKSAKLKRNLRIGWYITGVSSLLLISLKILPWFDQDNVMILMLLIPIYLSMVIAHRHLKHINPN